MSNVSAAAGWYPLPNDPSTERYWDGSRWTEHHRPRQPGPPAFAPQSSESSGASKVLIGILIGIALVIGGCGATVAILVNATADTIELLDTEE